MTTLQGAIEELEARGYEVEYEGNDWALTIINHDSVVQRMDVIYYNFDGYDTEKTINELKETGIEQMTFKSRRTDMTYIWSDMMDLLELARNMFNY